MNFKHWFEQQYDTIVDESEIERLYDKSHIAVDLVRMYRPELLHNISTIANLASGAYGVYNSGENQQVLDPQLKQRLIYWGHIPKNIPEDKIKKIPRQVIKQRVPDIDPKQIKISDTIRINVNRLLQGVQDHWTAIKRIASTIVHEAMHQLEYEQKGITQEATPQAEERKFLQWIEQNKDAIFRKYPELTQSSLTPKTPLNLQPFRTAS